MTTSGSFRIDTLISSVAHIVSTHAMMPNMTLGTSIDEQIPSVLFGDIDRIEQALIIVIERALIQRPNLPVILSCALIRRSHDRATISFSVTQFLDGSSPPVPPLPHTMVDEDFFTECPEELSLKIANRIIRENGGKLLLRPPNNRMEEVCFWVSLGVAPDAPVSVSDLPCPPALH